MRQKSKSKVRSGDLDQIDLNILSALFSRARVSKVQMSGAVGISASRCYERMRRLERTGVIRGYHADIDIARLANSMQFLVQIKLSNDSDARVKQFERAVLRMPEIISCRSVLGHIDYMMLIVVASIEQYQKAITELRLLSAIEFDFVTFPISKRIKSPGQNDLLQVVGRLRRAGTDVD